MENLKAFFMRRPERLLGRCGMLFLMAFFVMNLSSCNDDFIEDNGGEIIPPEEIVIPPVYMLLDGPYKWGVVLTQNEDSSYTIETTNGVLGRLPVCLKKMFPKNVMFLNLNIRRKWG